VLSLDPVLVLVVATLGLLAGRLVGLPSIVAYLVAGVVAGPGGLGLIGRSAAVEHLADIGVALLLFGVGIEFSLERLRRIFRRMVASGALQVVLTVTLGALAFRMLGAGWPVAVFVGFLVALSSTAIVFKLYEESGEIDAPHGLAAAGVLLFQDLALVPMILLVPVLAEPGGGGAVDALMALGRAAVAVGALLLLARVVLPRVLTLVARTRTPELFPLAALVIALGTAGGAAALGLSLPTGAFLAGLALSGSRYAHQVFAELLPLRDAFVALFFTSIGSLLDPQVALHEPVLFGGMIAAVLAKGALTGGIVGALWSSPRMALLVGLGLAQIGEFSFVLAKAGVESGLLSRPLEQAFLGGAIVTMAGVAALSSHVVMVGYGTTGRAVARVLRETGIPFVAVDALAEAVEAGHRERMPVQFGDASRRAVLDRLGVGRARAVVVAVSDRVATRRIVSLVRQLTDGARVIVRVRRVAEIEELERLGADEVIPSEFETSIEIFVRLLHHLGVPKHVTRVQESLIRLGHYQALRGVGSSTELLTDARRLIAGGILETAQVMSGSRACGRTLAELNLRRETGATVLSVVRREGPLPSVDGPTRLEAEDLVVLYGPHEAIDRALALLEPPEAGARE
jgi:CPA2 family monovalent cation:H+ antiporter-2